MRLDVHIHALIMNGESNQSHQGWRQEAATLHHSQAERAPVGGQGRAPGLKAASRHPEGPEGPGWGFSGEHPDVHPKERAVRPPSFSECCPSHRGDYRGWCRGCQADQKTGTPSPEPVGLLPTTENMYDKVRRYLDREDHYWAIHGGPPCRCPECIRKKTFLWDTCACCERAMRPTHYEEDRGLCLQCRVISVDVRAGRRPAANNAPRAEVAHLRTILRKGHAAQLPQRAKALTQSSIEAS